jgi:tetratricopeptide (TPR) repeat protein
VGNSTHREFATFYQNQKNPAAAAMHLRPAVELGEQIREGSEPGTSSQAILPVRYQELGSLYRNLGRTQDAEQVYRKALERAAELCKRDRSNRVYVSQLASNHFARGMLYQTTGRFPEAREDYANACKILEPFSPGEPGERSIFPSTRLLGAVHLFFGLLENDEGQPEKALRWLKRAIDEYKAVCSQDKGNNVNKADLQGAYLERASTLCRLGCFHDSARDLEEASKLDDGKRRGELGFLRAVVAAYEQGREPGWTDLANYRQAADEYKALAVKVAQQPGSDLYDNAVVHALFLKGCQLDPNLAPDPRNELAEPYAAEAVALLGQVRKAGYFTIPSNQDRLGKEKAFVPLQSRPDFAKLRTEVEAEAKESKPEAKKP